MTYLTNDYIISKLSDNLCFYTKQLNDNQLKLAKTQKMSRLAKWGELK